MQKYMIILQFQILGEKLYISYKRTFSYINFLFNEKKKLFRILI